MILNKPLKFNTMSKLIDSNALVLRRQLDLGKYHLTNYASQNFHNALTVTFKESGEEFLVGIYNSQSGKESNVVEIFQDIDFFKGDNPKVKVTFPNGIKEYHLDNEQKLNGLFSLRKIESKCNILQIEEELLPKKNPHTRTHTRGDHFKQKELN